MRSQRLSSLTLALTVATAVLLCLPARATEPTAESVEELSWARIKGVYVGIYRESFTQEEIDGMLVFYKSPVGQAFVRKMLQVMQRSGQVMQVLAAPMAEKTRAAMERAVAQARSAG